MSTDPDRAIALATLKALRPAADADDRYARIGQREVGLSVQWGLLFKHDLNPVRGLDLHDPIGPVLARPLHGHLEAETRLFAGGDRGVRVAHGKLPGQARRGRIGVRTSAQPELDGVVTDRDEARVLRTLIGRAQTQLLIE